MQATFEYHKLLQEILDKGKHRGDRTGTGTVSIFDYKIKFDMDQGFPLITTKKIHTRSICHELIWFLNGDTNIKYLNDNGVTIWDEWADEKGELGPIYGKQWVNWGRGERVNRGYEYGAPTHFEHNPLNQVQNAVDTLKNNPESRRIIVSAWNPEEIGQMGLPPCHWAFELYTEELTLSEKLDIVKERWPHLVNEESWEGLYVDSGDPQEWLTTFGIEDVIPTRRLHLKWHQRSVDTFLGLPFNIASYALLLHMFAQQTNMVPGQLVGDLTNVHIYDNHIEYVKKQLDRPYNRYCAPTLKLNKAKDIFSYKFEDFEVANYECFSNWKNVPIAI